VVNPLYNRSFRDETRKPGPDLLRAGFTVVELVTAAAIASFLAVLVVAVAGKMRSHAQGVTCANSLRQLGVATHLYLGENRQVFFPYSLYVPGVGKYWYFGLEPESSLNKPEGEREIIPEAGPLGPYIDQVGGIARCPAFSYENPLVKRKFKGASFGYGYNWLLNKRSAMTLSAASRVIIFGDCAYINNFEPPASPTQPLLEEFNQINQSDKTIHFRHGSRAQFVFVDGHVEAMRMYPGTLDKQLPSVNLGRITAVGSTEYLK